MSILDLVKHAVKTIINTLNENDRLSIVTFNTCSNVETKLTEMNEGNKQTAIATLENIFPNSRTNIWAGLKDGLDQLRTDGVDHRRKFLFLLTDGQPVERPQNGEENALKD